MKNSLARESNFYKASTNLEGTEHLINEAALVYFSTLLN